MRLKDTFITHDSDGRAGFNRCNQLICRTCQKQQDSGIHRGVPEKQIRQKSRLWRQCMRNTMLRRMCCKRMWS